MFVHNTCSGFVADKTLSYFFLTISFMAFLWRQMSLEGKYHSRPFFGPRSIQVPAGAAQRVPPARRAAVPGQTPAPAPAPAGPRVPPQPPDARARAAPALRAVWDAAAGERLGKNRERIEKTLNWRRQNIC